MKNWTINKKPRQETTPDQKSQSKTISGMNSVLDSQINADDLNTLSHLTPNEENFYELTEDHTGSI
jgi:hypothetical protein